MTSFKMKRHLFLIFVLVFSLNASSQPKTKFDGKNWEAPYILDIPKGWDVERFLIPIEFAPVINYKGVEDIRFTPGWGKKETNDYWSYAFLWYLDSTINFDSKTFESNLTAYYTGLININVDKTKLTDKLVPVEVSVKERSVEKDDAKTFEGTVSMSDFLTQKPIKLNLLIHVKYCEGPGKTLIFHELSPKPYSDKVWTGLDQLWTDFKCRKE
ncbi:MAG: hypothetical protein ACJ749_07145 [Flavisolibacter sp.]